MNTKFLTEVQHRTRELAVSTMDQATEVLLKEITRGPATGTTPEAWARHLAWVIGFDTLVDDRKRLAELTSFMLPDQPTT